MAISGKWWWWFDGEPFDVSYSRWFELADGVVTHGDGSQATYTLNGNTLRIGFPTSGDLVVEHSAPITDSVTVLSGYSPEDDEAVVLAKDGDWAEKLTARNRERAGRYTTIDVSMYPFDAPGQDELARAETVEEIEAALAKMPDAKFTHDAGWGSRPEGVVGFP